MTIRNMPLTDKGRSNFDKIFGVKKDAIQKALADISKSFRKFNEFQQKNIKLFTEKPMNQIKATDIVNCKAKAFDTRVKIVGVSDFPTTIGEKD